MFAFQRWTAVPCLVACLLVCSCGEPDAPVLQVSIKRDDGGGSTSRFRVTGVGVISESGDQGGGGAVSQRIVIDKIDQAGVTLTAILARREAGGPDDGVSKQLFVASGGEATVARVGDTTWSVRLEPPEE